MVEKCTVQSDYDGLTLEIMYLVPDNKKIKGVVQISHGMSEHKERYLDFMKYLGANGYVSVIHDHRGHGASVKDSRDLGYFYTNDETVLARDLYAVTEFIKKKYPDLPITLFSHSMGTLVARNYLQKYDDKIDKLVLCGPPTKNQLAVIGIGLSKICSLFVGDKKPNKLLDTMTFSTYNKGFKEKNAWLSLNKDNVYNYNNDTLCGFTFTTNGFYILYKLLFRAYKKQSYLVKNAKLPMLIIAGSDDPVIGSLDKLYDLQCFLRTLGYKNVDVKIYDKLRHELLLEDRKYGAYEDILAFLENNN